MSQIDTAGLSNGEVTGTFAKGTGAAGFNIPPPPPAMDLSAVPQADAARFLIQSTFGATTADVTALMQRGYAGWIGDQMALPPRRTARSRWRTSRSTPRTPTRTLPTPADRQAAWWKIAVTGPGPARQRVAFALSEIFVIRTRTTRSNTWQEATANYYDLLAKIPSAISGRCSTTSRSARLMGIYLSMLRSGKGTFRTRRAMC